MRPTPPLPIKLTRLPLTTKQINGGYYKGTGTGSMGRHTKYGGYIIDWAKVRTYVVPEGLKDCRLSPFVSKKIKAKETGDGIGMFRGKEFLEHWKLENGRD